MCGAGKFEVLLLAPYRRLAGAVLTGTGMWVVQLA